MDNSTLNHHHRGTSPLSKRKRSHEPHDVDAPSAPSVRRRTDEHGHMHRTRSRSPRPSSRSDHHDTARARHVSHTRHRRRSNARDDRHDAQHRSKATHQKRSQSRSPTRPRDSHRHHHRSHHAPKASGLNHDQELPCNARALSRSADFNTFRPLFARYLDVQKQIDITALDEREVRGRWKSFVNKWNNGELAEGWYRPETFEDATLDAQGGSNLLETEGRQERERNSPARQEADLRQQNARRRDEQDNDEQDEDNDDDDYGPILPTQDNIDSRMGTDPSLSQTRHGPGIPTLSDLTLRREHEASDRDDARTFLRLERKADRTLQKERQDELAPRADAGTQARRLEKRREVRDSNTSFANAKSSNEIPELADADLMGGDGGGVEEYKRMKREAERKKTEREIRREEIWRTKKEEREEKLREYREREARTVDMLREIARSRFG